MFDLRPALVCSLMLPALLAQDPTPPETPPTPPAAAETAPAKKTAEQWIQDLGSDSYRTRIGAERALRQLGKDAVAPLQRAAESAEDPEVQWRARRLLNQLDRPLVVERSQEPRGSEPAPAEPRNGLRRRGRADAGQPMRAEFDAMFEQLERQFGIDVPRARFFNDGFFRDLQEQMQTPGQGTSQGMTMQIGPDGKVRVEVKEQNDKGEVSTKVYEAPDLETFQREHPGVLRQNRLGLGLAPFDGGGAFRGMFGPLDLNFDGLAPRAFTLRGLANPPGASVDLDDVGPDAMVDVEPPTPPPAGRRLGVVVRPQIHPDLRSYLELADGVGLMVESVQEGSLAQALGLAKGDVVVEIAGRPIGSTDDVQRAIGPIEQGADVEVKFVRRAQTMTAKAKKTEAAAKVGKLEPRGSIR